jgi:hypothetical protein
MSCGNPGSNSKTKAIKSFELSYNNDTINVIDAYGRKQGIWLTKKDSKDTIVYLNDTAYLTTGKTAREFIRSLNEKRK